ncbi:MAG: metallophosphoesterase [Clostridia bacterium]|nr:metallophosphoesterase [Clostridia bacterium]
MEEKNKKYSKLKTPNNVSTIAKVDQRLESFKEQIAADDFSPIKTIQVDASQNEEIVLLVLNDLHIGSPGCNIDKILRALKEVKHIPNAYIILNGDLMNNANNIGKSSPLENDLSPMNEQKIIHTIFSDPIIKNKIICSTSGNHESGARAKDSGLDSLGTPMASLGLLDKYARYMAQIVIKIKCPYTQSGTANCRVLVRHGTGVGGKSGAILDKMFGILRDFGNYDVVFQGHTHKNLMSLDDQVVQNGKYSTIKKPVSVINVPSFEEASQYAMEVAMPAPNTDNSFYCIKAVTNFDALDSYLNDGYNVLPYSFVVDTVSLDRPELVKLGELNFDTTIDEDKLERAIDNLTNRTTKKVKRPRAKKQQEADENEEGMEA